MHYHGLDEPGLHVLLNTGDSWSHENMTADRGLPPPAPGTKPANFLNDADGSLHVAYIDINGDVWDFLYPGGQGQPVVINVSQDRHAPAAMARTSPSGYAFRHDRTAHLVFTSADNRLFDFTFTP